MHARRRASCGPRRCSRGRARRSPTSSSISARRAPARCATRSPRRSAIPRSRSATGSVRRYIDAAGRPLVLPAAESNRRVTRVDRDGEAIAVLVHDAAVLDDPGLSDALARAARLAAANAAPPGGGPGAGRRARRIAPAPGSCRRRGAAPARAASARHGGAAPGRRSPPRSSTHSRGRRAPRPSDASRSSSIARSTSCALWPPGFIRAESSPAGSPPPSQRWPRAALCPSICDVTDVRVAEELERATWFVCSEALANVIKHAGASSAAISVG